ncbi:uncharacterized protein LOC119967540 [Scyliorhinus canicula]|uniref:uncharacterized protein LOC119967540 n=1 Tax=Scyliorhinus canicula TaxID=7830 RepID=UPI0018F36910|nr:uncharacterized protein LOC119967540 [Scyliorhinus canicula]
MEDIIVEQLYSINKASENEMEHPASKRLKLFSGPCYTVEEPVEKNLSSTNKAILNDRNEFAWQEDIESNTVVKTMDGKNNIISSGIEQEGFGVSEYGFENYSTNCEDPNIGTTDLAVPLQMEKHTEKLKHKRCQGVLIPGIENYAYKTDLLLLGHKFDVQDNETLHSTKIGHKQALDKIMISSDIIVAKYAKIQKDIDNKPEYKINNLLTCESAKSKENEANDICVESVKACGPQDERSKINNMYNEELECIPKTRFNSLPITNTRNASVDSTESILGVPLTTKGNEIQKDTRMFNQTEKPVFDMGNIKSVNVIQSSCSLNCSTLNETAHETDTQKIAPENSSGLFSEKIQAINKNENTTAVNMHYHGDSDIAVNDKSTGIQIYKIEDSCIDAVEVQELDNSGHVNKYIAASGILNANCDIVHPSKELGELNYEGTSKNPDKNNQFINDKSAEEAASIIQFQLSEEKQSELMRKVPEISNSENIHISENISSNENENRGNFQAEIKFEILEGASLTEGSESVSDILQNSCSHSHAETDDFPAVPRVDLTSQDTIYSYSHKCQSRFLPINPSEKFENKSEVISAFEQSENLEASYADSERNGTSGNEEEYELMCLPGPDFLLVKSNDRVSCSGDHCGSVMQIECAGKIEQPSTFASLILGSVDLSGITDIALPSHENKAPEDNYATQIPASAFGDKNSVVNGSGAAKIISGNTGRQQSDSNVVWPRKNKLDISEKEAECQLKYLSNPYFVNDRDFHTGSISHYLDTDSAQRMQNECTNQLGQFSISGDSVTNYVPRTNVNALLLSQKPEILRKHRSSRVKGTTYDTENSTKEEITIFVSGNGSIQTSFACNLIKNSEVNDFSIQKAEYQLKYVTSPNYLRGTDSDMHRVAVNVLQTTLCLQGDKGQRSETGCVSKVCSFTEDSLLNCTINMPLCHQNKALYEQATSDINENDSEEAIVFSENAAKQTSLEGPKKIEMNNISMRERACQQKYVSRSSCVKHPNNDVYKELSMLYGIPLFDTDNRYGFQSEWSDKLAQSSILGVSTKMFAALGLPQKAPHFNQWKETLNEEDCNKIFSTRVATENSIDDKITAGVSENGSVQTSIVCNMAEDAEANNCSENKAECNPKCLISTEQPKSTSSNMDSVPVNVLPPVHWLENDSGKESELRCPTETVQFSSVCNLMKDNALKMCTAHVLLYHQNKLLDEHCASPTDVFSYKNNSEETKIVFTENLDRQKTSLLSYTRTGINCISKREMEFLQKYTNSCDYVRHSDNDFYAKVNTSCALPHCDTENKHAPQSDYSYRRAKPSYFSNSSRDAVPLSNPVTTSPFGLENEILEVDEGATMLDAEDNIEENIICPSKYGNIQISVTCNEMIEDTTVNDSSENHDDHANDSSCVINDSDNMSIHLVNVFHETPLSEASNRHLAQIKCSDKTGYYSNICSLLKDCSGLNRTINTSPYCELKEKLAGCSRNKTAAVTFSTDAAVKEKTALEIEGSKKADMIVKEESKHPEIMINRFSEITSSYGSAFDSFEKITLNTDIEELETVTLIREVDCSSKETHNKSLTKQFIYDNDNSQSNQVWLPQRSSFKPSLVVSHQSNINNSEETKSLIVSEKDRKEYCHLGLSGMLQSRTKEENNIAYAKTSQPLARNYKLEDVLQVYTESNMYENKQESKELSCDMVNIVQSAPASLQKEDLIPSLDSFSCADTVLVEMDQKGQKQKTSESASTLVSLSVDPARILQRSCHANELPAVCKLNIEEDKKSRKLNFTLSKQEFKQDISITTTAQDPLPCQIETKSDSYMKASGEYESSTCSISQGSLCHQVQKPGNTVDQGGNGNFREINSDTGSTIVDVNVRQSKKQFIHSNDDIPNFEMKEQFNAVLEELCLFHEISRQSEWPDSVIEENVTEIANDKRDLDELPGGLDKISNLSMGPMHDDLQDFILSHEKTALSHKDHDHLIGEDVSQHASPAFAKKTSVIKGEQEVPMEIDASETEREESMYTPHKVSEYRGHDCREAKTWSSAFNFQTICEKTVDDRMQSQTGPYLSNGLLRIEPLKTCSGPIRIGLSKRTKAKHLHPYLR